MGDPNYEPTIVVHDKCMLCVVCVYVCVCVSAFVHVMHVEYHLEPPDC